MKTNKFYLLVIACLFSCNDTERTTDRSSFSKENETALIFKSLNDSLFNLPNYPVIDVSTRGWGDSFRKGLILAGADFLGAGGGIAATKEIAGLVGVTTGGTGAIIVCAIGGVLGGASASLAANYALKSTSSSTSESGSTSATTFTLSSKTVIDAYQQTKADQIAYIKLDFPERFNYINIMGGLHNTILDYVSDMPVSTESTTAVAKMSSPTEINSEPQPVVNPAIQLNNPNLYKQESIQESVASISSTAYQEVETQLLESVEFSQICNNVVGITSASCVNATFDGNAFLNNLNVSMTKNERTIYNLYSEIYSRYPENINDVILIANEYIKKIEQMPALTDVEREKLYLSISISVNSAYYWNK